MNPDRFTSILTKLQRKILVSKSDSSLNALARVTIMNRETTCRKIYRQAFCDPDTAFEDILFEHCFKYSKTLELGEDTVSMLFALPCSLMCVDEKKPAIYLYAAATDKAFRGKGYMSHLIEKLKTDTEKTIFLRPANESLIGFYEKLGFKTISTYNQKENSLRLEPEEGFEKLVKSSGLPDDAEDFILMYYSKSEEINERVYFVNSMD